MAGILHSYLIDTVAIPDDGSTKVGSADWNAAHTIEAFAIENGHIKDATIEKTKLSAAAQLYLVPSGGIILWSGASNAIPSGWLLCNGENGTPNLRDRFIVGAGTTYAVGATGGALTHVHSDMTAESGGVDHTHLVEILSNDCANYGGQPRGSTASNLTTEDHQHSVYGNTGTASAYAHTHTLTDGTAVSNLPPYYSLCYIMKS